MGVNIVTYSHHEANIRPFPDKRARVYADFFRVTPEYLLYGRRALQEAPPETVRVEGLIGLKTPLERFSQPQKHLCPPYPSAETHCVQISDPTPGAMMDGWLVFYDGDADPVTIAQQNLLSVVVVLEGKAEEVYLRRISPSETPGKYHLTSLDGGVVFNQQIVRASRVIAIMPL